MRESKPNLVDLYEALSRGDDAGEQQATSLTEQRRRIEEAWTSNSVEQHCRRIERNIKAHRTGIEIDERRIQLWQRGVQDKNAREEIARSRASIDLARMAIAVLEQEAANLKRSE
jgi:hypothetical protein